MKERKSRFFVDKKFGFYQFDKALGFSKTQCQGFEITKDGDKIFTPSIIFDSKTKKNHIVKYRPTKGIRVFVLW